MNPNKPSKKQESIMTIILCIMVAIYFILWVVYGNLIFGK
jgi:hypothetical protein